MKFWDKFWKLVSIKDLVFVTLVLVFVFVFSFFEAENKVTVTFGENTVDIKAPRYGLSVPYDLIESADLTILPDAGQNLDGRDDMVTRIGYWKNDEWNEYYICADLAASKCIVLHLNDGRTFVFSRKSDKATEEVYNQLLTYLK